MSQSRSLRQCHELCRGLLASLCNLSVNNSLLCTASADSRHAMHLPIAAVVLSALYTTCAADYLEVYQRCRARDKCEGLGYFNTDYGEYEVSGNGGCHRTKVPYMTEFCIDWRLGRAHFRFQGQGDKRCLLLVSTQDWKCSFRMCYVQVFQEIGCYWFAAESGREDDGALPFTMKKPEVE
ncbi:hypothetical protein CCM_01459 [Cordyceps militaris CM01]|uniref:Uncharacterized protein n=2 Tax=Cordyceps militaris TaxID=73501 RepID=G3J591_CORMM|nr:uncharacterized protein CCM_01459 [Cordyceps militaris CM01]ATY65200.1 hypothetical protein A9K55_004875 [Cordyceps militaris]EGX96801.1 hypothetical protein CCM_01459 [Cordyceps militaris CM01]